MNIFEPVVANDPVLIAIPGAYDADNAVVANEDDTANDAVPSNEPVIPPLNVAEPDTSKPLNT